MAAKKRIPKNVGALLRQHARKIRALHKGTLANIIEIGRRLIAARDICEHGQWLPWLEREFKWSRQTADNFIALYEARDKLLKFGNFDVPLSAYYCMARPSTPAAAITAIHARAKAGEPISLHAVRQTIAQHREASTSAQPIALDTQHQQPPNQSPPNLVDLARSGVASTIARDLVQLSSYSGAGHRHAIPAVVELLLGDPQKLAMARSAIDLAIAIKGALDEAERDQRPHLRVVD